MGGDRWILGALAGRANLSSERAHLTAVGRSAIKEANDGHEAPSPCTGTHTRAAHIHEEGEVTHVHDYACLLKGLKSNNPKETE